MLGPNGCMMTITASSGTPGVYDSSNLYDIWQAFVTVKGMCVRQGKTGRVRGLGSQGRLTLQVNPYVEDSISLRSR